MKFFITLMFLAIAPNLYGGDLKTLAAGDTVPGFTLKNYDGSEQSLAGHLKDNDYAVVMFIATRCPVSNAYNTRMADLATDYGKKKIAFVAINSNKAEDAKEVMEHAQEHKFSFPVLKDPNNIIADAYGALVTPEIFVVDKNLKLLYHGRIDDNRKIEKVEKHELTDALNAILAGKEVSPEQPRAFGCTIKRVEDAKP